MSRCLKCGKVYFGYSTYCYACQWQIDHAAQVEYDERQVRDWDSIVGEALHGQQAERERRWRIG